MIINRTEDPPCDGLYCGYMAYLARPGEYFPMVLVFAGGKWTYHLSGQRTGLEVVGWIGPLPAWDATHAARNEEWMRDAGFTAKKPQPQKKYRPIPPQPPAQEYDL